jgi:hypothetical protein
VAHDVHVPGLPEVGEDACYRAMDWLLDVEPTLARSVYDSVADLLNLEVDLLFFDTTSTHFQIEQADESVPRDQTGQRVEDPDQAATAGPFRTWGKSKDHRDDLPQVVIGMAVTRDGIPVRVWSWPGNTTGTALIRQVKTDLRDWTLGKVVWVADRGFTSTANRRALAAGAGGYILGEKLRSGTAEATAALSRPGRYATVADNLRVKEVRISAHERFIVCHNPDTVERDAAIRADMIDKLRELIDGSDALSERKRAELRGVISTKPGLNRYLRVTPSGLLRLDQAAITAEAKLDGKYLLRTSDPHLSAEDVALGYQQLAAIERAWRDMKHVIDLRPVYHRLERPHPRPRPALLARPAPHPHRRDPHRHDLAPAAPRPATPARRHLHRPSRHLPADDHPQHRGHGRLPRSGRRTATEGPPPRHPRRPSRGLHAGGLTRHNTWA